MCYFLFIIIAGGLQTMEDAKEMNLNSNNLVVMSNDLIKSKSNLSLNEIKILRLAIMQVIKEDKDLQTYKVNVTELADLLAIDRHGIYQEVDKITTSLLKEIVYIGDGNPKHKWKKFQWCSSCQYENGVLTIKLHDDLKPFLLNLSELYTQYVLEDILYLKSVYSIRIYELIREEMRYQKVFADKEADIYLPMDIIRKATDTESKYNQYGMFKARVIDAAVNEINEKLQYYVTYEPVKESRKVIGFNFHIMSNLYAHMKGLTEWNRINKK